VDAGGAGWRQTLASAVLGYRLLRRLDMSGHPRLCAFIGLGKGVRDTIKPGSGEARAGNQISVLFPQFVSVCSIVGAYNS
jgi:hypothetical protein